ncbi:MAG: hypothetical protein JW901_02050 [Dehalococcoidia bacterium]|nr:hypothetical protein [Dehalococcoidia bacterium]
MALLAPPKLSAKHLVPGSVGLVVFFLFITTCSRYEKAAVSPSLPAKGYNV